MVKPVVIGDATLYCCDCLDLMREMPAGSVDAVVTDPPYGININKSNRLSISRGFGADTWDTERPYSRVDYMLDKFGDKPVVIWGGNYFASILPDSRGWLIWDKINEGRDFGEAELAWTNQDAVIRKYEKFPVKLDGGKVHPTQKPIELIVWSLEYIRAKTGAVVFDPFFGSGTTAVACLKTGRKFIGSENNEGHFETACRRIRDAAAQPLLWSA